MELKKTQRIVLEFLAKNPDKTYTPKEIERETGVTSNHVSNALKFAYDNDFVYETVDGYSITPDGESALR